MIQLASEGFVASRFLKRLASLKLTLVLLLVFALAVVAWHFNDPVWRDHLIAWPLLLLAFNLTAALLTHPTFRNQAWLLVFHLALLLLLIILALGQLTLLLGEVEVTRGTAYNSKAASWHKGYLHHSQLDDLAFELVDFSIEYAPEAGIAQRKQTRALLRWQDEQGQVQQGLVGDKVGLVLKGYRFTTTHNKGFAAWFSWRPKQGEVVEGAVHFHPWPANKLDQTSEWHIPTTSHYLWAQLKFDDPILSDIEPSHFRLPNDAVLVVRVEGERYELKPGQSVELVDGRLVYQELRTWMGFRIFYDWTLPWLLAAGLVAVFGLAGHFWRKYASTSWLDEEQKAWNENS